jgi:hypothetical protein
LPTIDDRHERVGKSSCREEAAKHVWIVGSVNMDVVATAARHPRIGETVVGKEVFSFPARSA